MAFFSGQKSTAPLHRQITELLDLGFLARIVLPRVGGGHGFPLYTVVCTAEDRSGATSAQLTEQAKARPLKVVETPKTLEVRKEPATHQIGETQYTNLVGCPKTNAPNRCDATHQIGEHTVEVDTVKVS